MIEAIAYLVMVTMTEAGPEFKVMHVFQDPRSCFMMQKQLVAADLIEEGVTDCVVVKPTVGIPAPTAARTPSGESSNAIA